MGLADTERNRAAVHEAGHGLIAASRGLGVAVMELHAIDGEGGMRLCEEPSVLDRVWVLYGGPFAEKVFFGRLTSAAVPPERDELLLAHKLCREIGINNTIGFMDQVETYLREHQSLLELVATRLLEANKLQGADLDQLLRTDFPATPRKVLGAVIPHAVPTPHCAGREPHPGIALASDGTLDLIGGTRALGDPNER